MSDDGFLTGLSEERRAKLLDFGFALSPVIFYVADPERLSHFLYISENVEAATGYRPSDFVDDPTFSRSQLHPDDVAGYIEAMGVLATEETAGHEYRFRCKDGRYRWFRDEARVMGRRPDHEVFGCMTDITERVVAEQESRRLSQLLRDAVESIPNGFAIYDREERLILCNGAFSALIGASAGSLSGSWAIDNTRRLLQQLRSFDGKAVGDPEASLPRALARAREAEREPIEMQLKTGRWLQMTSHALAGGGHVDIRTDISRLKLAEASLSKSEEQFRAIVETNPSPVRVADFATWEILYESPAAAALFGRPWPSKERRSTSETYADMAAREEVIRTLGERGRIDNFEIEMKRADGARFWVALSSRVVRYRGTDVCVTSLVDLTEAKTREAELRRSRETLEDAIESLSEGFILYDADDRLVLCNSQYKSFHKGAEDLLVPGAYWRDVTRQRAERGLFVEAAGQIEDWLADQMSRRNTAKDEEFPFSSGRWYAYSHRPTRQGGFVSTWREITERKMMEQSLRDSEELVRQVLEACPVPITMTRAADGVIIYESPAAQALLHYDESQVGRSVRARWVDDGEREAYLERLRRTGAIDGLEIRYRNALGEVFWCALSSRLIAYRGEAVIVSNLFDLTERRAAEAELERQREMLHQSEKLSALGELLAGVSHELNNPLSVLVGQSLMLRETAPDAKVAARAEKISKAADRCARIVKAFLAMARQQPAEYAPVGMNQIVEATLEVLSYSLRADDIRVRLELSAELPDVWGNADHLNQVLTNLLVNAQQALQSIDGPRRLTVASRCDGAAGEVQLSVADNGPGIGPEIRSRIFDPLFTTKETGVGTGIGLAVSHRIVEAHGGRISVDSTPGRGTSFTLKLPRHKAGAGDRAAPRRDQAASPGCRVLVIDDEPEVAQMLADMLTNDAHRTRIATSGRDALAALRRADYDVIFSDLRMPGLDGPDLLAAMRKESPQLVERVAFVTGDTLSPKARDFLRSCGRPYIEKPFSQDDVRDLLRQVAGNN